MKQMKSLKNSTIYPKNNDEKCFQKVLTIALSYKHIKNHSERISETKPFFN